MAEEDSESDRMRSPCDWREHRTGSFSDDEGLTATNDVVRTMPVIRPLISFDKEDIIKIARNIENI